MFIQLSYGHRIKNVTAHYLPKHCNVSKHPYPVVPDWSLHVPYASKRTSCAATKLLAPKIRSQQRIKQEMHSLVTTWFKSHFNTTWRLFKFCSGPCLPSSFLGWLYWGSFNNYCPLWVIACSSRTFICLGCTAVGYTACVSNGMDHGTACTFRTIIPFGCTKTGHTFVACTDHLQ